MKTSAKIKLAKFIFYILIFFGFKKKILARRKQISWDLDLSEGIDLSIFLFGTFQGEIVKSMTNYIFKENKKSFDIIDVGSNIGDKSLSLANNLLKNKFYKFKIFSIEPTDYAYKKQIKNIFLNPILKKKILSFKLYISNKKKKAKEALFKLEIRRKS